MLSLKRLLYRILPSQITNILKPLYNSLIDLIDNLTGQRDDMVPPSHLQNSIGGRKNYAKIGETFLQYFLKFGEIEPDSQILEVGCGTGRMAVPLTGYLNDKGRYDGFDIMEDAIVWCQGNISTRYPRFSFQLADVYNFHYNPKGTSKAHEYSFPYEDGEYDFVFLTSVFTHMLPADLENYLSEIGRVLKKGGRCLISYFLLNPESLALMGKGTSHNFQYTFDGYRAHDKENPEAAIAYEEEYIRGLYQRYGLSISEPLRFGSWSGRADSLDYQDFVVALKE